MLPPARSVLASVLCATAAMAVSAQSSPAAPAAPAAPAVELTYRSAFDGYQRFTDEKVGSWRDANDTVGRIGGWREYAKEGREPAAPRAAGATPAAPAADPHSGHGKQ